ncbi:MAG: ribosome silencing factor [Reichenbachiella sp.]
MTELQEVLDSQKTSRIVINGMLEKKAQEVVMIDLKEISNAVADYFIICSGGSDIQVDAIAESVEEAMNKQVGVNPWRKEGGDNKEWILLDYADVVVHIFNKEKRAFYGLEKLWGDAVITSIES